MPWPWVQLPQKIMHSVGLSRITDKLIPSIDWKKSFNRSSAQAWDSRDHLLWAVKIQTNRLYFSRGYTPSATGVGAGDTHGGSETGPSTWSSLPVPAAPRSGGGELVLAGSSFTVLDLLGIFSLHVQVRW